MSRERTTSPSIWKQPATARSASSGVPATCRRSSTTTSRSRSRPTSSLSCRLRLPRIRRGSCRLCTRRRKSLPPKACDTRPTASSFRPDGTINATDGRQLLIQSGFSFPWQDAVLVPRQQGLHVAGVATGPAGCRRKERRLGGRQCRPLDRLSADQHTAGIPKCRDIVPDPDTAKARCQLVEGRHPLPGRDPCRSFHATKTTATLR